MKKRRLFFVITALSLLMIANSLSAFASSSKNTDTDSGPIDGTYTFTGDNDWYGYRSYLNEEGLLGDAHITGRVYKVTIPDDGRIQCEVTSEDTPIAMNIRIGDSTDNTLKEWHCGSQSGTMSLNKTSQILDKGTYIVWFLYERDGAYAMKYNNYWDVSRGLPGKKYFYHKITFKGLTAEEKAAKEKAKKEAAEKARKEKEKKEEESRKRAEANKKKLKIKSLWASKHEVGKVTFKWTKKDKTSVTGWKLKYRTRKIGGNNKWSSWTTKSFGANTMQAKLSVPVNYVIEVHAQAKGDTVWSSGIITTPAGGKYQAMKHTYVRNVNTRQRITSITLKKGSVIRIKPDYVYPVSDYNKRPRLYPTHMLYDIGNSKIIGITNPQGKKYTGGILDGIATVKGLKKGKTTLICRAPNGRTCVMKVTVK